MAPNDIGILTLRALTGVFFITTGYRKIWNPVVHRSVFALFDKYGVPKELQRVIIAGEFLGGLGLFFGCLTQPAAAGLLVIMLGAYKLDTWPAVKAKQAGKFSLSRLVSNALCTPEAQLISILVALLSTGAGAFSLDAIMWRF
jgi:uncharacterized membrane protein YphA (DoxX/SURF4 family)